MKISPIINILILAVSVTGFAALFLSNTVGPFFTAIFTLSVTACLIRLKNPSFLNLNKKYLNSAIYIVLLFLVADFILTDTELLTTLINFLLALHSIKLISDKDLRDYQQIMLLSFFQVVASCVLTTSFSFGFILLFYLFVAILALTVLNIKKESENAAGKNDAKLDLFSLMRFEFLIVVFVIALTSVFFLVMPRFNSEFISGSFARPTSIKSGFSDEITLGRLGEIKSDSSPVMRIYIENHDPDDIDGPLYWRGLALDEFNGTTWKIGQKAERSYHREDLYGDIRLTTKPLRQNDMLKQEIITEPVDTKVLFSANRPVVFSDVPGSKIVASNSSYSLYEFKRSRIKYQVYSDVRRPDPEKLESDIGIIPTGIKNRYSGSVSLSERFKDFADAMKEEGKSNYYHVEKVSNYLLNNYKYTRVMKKGKELYPIDDFLFDYREGHCEYFASAMVLILREMNIPSRIVTGFLGGEFNTHGSFYLVRESNAHAWVEVYFPENGWVLFDPTPEASGNFNIINASYIASYIDYLKFRWSRYVIDFTRRDQLNFFENVNSKMPRTGFALKDSLLSNFSFDRDVLLLITLIVFSIVVVKNRKIKLGFGKGKPDKATIIYSKILKKLQNKNIRIDDFQTSRELLDDFAEKYPQLQINLYYIVQLYQDIRFGGKCNDESLEKLERLSKEFTALLSHQEKHNNYKREYPRNSDQQ